MPCRIWRVGPAVQRVLALAPRLLHVTQPCCAACNSNFASLVDCSTQCDVALRAGKPESCLLTDARILEVATAFGLAIGVLVYSSATFSGVCSSWRLLEPYPTGMASSLHAAVHLGIGM